MDCFFLCAASRPPSGDMRLRAGDKGVAIGIEAPPPPGPPGLVRLVHWIWTTPRPNAISWSPASRICRLRSLLQLTIIRIRRNAHRGKP